MENSLGDHVILFKVMYVAGTGALILHLVMYYSEQGAMGL